MKKEVCVDPVDQATDHAARSVDTLSPVRSRADVRASQFVGGTDDDPFAAPDDAGPQAEPEDASRERP